MLRVFLELGKHWKMPRMVDAILVGVIFVFASLFPTLFLLIVVVFVINYGLDCFTNLGIAYIYHSAHQLFEYKLVLVFLKLEV